MKYRLRADIEIYTADELDDADYLARDPLTGETFQFDEIEHFLLSSLRQAQTAEALAQTASARFDMQIATTAASEFVTMLASWGLLESSSGGAAPDTPNGSDVDDADALMIDEAEAIMLDVVPALRDQPTDLSNPRSQGGAGSRRRPATRGHAFDHKGHVGLFNPTPLFRALSWMGWFFRSPLAWLLIPALLSAMLVIYYNIPALAVDLALYYQPLTLIQHLIIALFTVHLGGQLAQGATLAQSGVRISSFGIRFVMGLIPRFDLKADDVDERERNDRIRIYATPLLFRVWVFSLCIAGWSMTRSSGNDLSAYFLSLGAISLISLFLMGNPLLKGAGYRTLAAILDQPLLREKANRALFRREAGAGQDNDNGENRLALKTYALASFIFLIAFLGVLGAYVARWLELNYQGTGVALFLLLLLYLVLRFRRQIKARQQQRRGQGRRRDALRGGDSVPMTSAAQERSRRPSTKRKPPRPRRPWLLYLFLIVFLAVLPLPYPYETGGRANVFGVKEYEMYADEPGIIDEVLFDGGEWIPKDTVVARMTAYSQAKDVTTTEAAIAKQRAELEKLGSTPRDEEVALAEQQLVTATVRAKYSADTVKRLTPLYEKGNVSLEDYADAESNRDLDKAREAEARSSLELVRSGVHPMDLTAAEAELERLQAQLRYDQEQLRRTALRTPIDGRPIGTNLTQETGRYLDRGDLFTRVVDDRSVRVEIAIPESDVGEVAIGSRARVRVWAYPQQTFIGTVEEIAPAVEEQSFGGIVRVIVLIPNEDRLLKSGMTGFGKVAAGEKPVLIAFTRALVRFALVEVWSWVP